MIQRAFDCMVSRANRYNHVHEGHAFPGAGCSKLDYRYNPGLKFNPLFEFVFFRASLFFKTSEKTPIDPNKISNEIFPSS